MSRLQEIIDEFAEKVAEEFSTILTEKAGKMLIGEPKVRRKRAPNKSKDEPTKRTRKYTRKKDGGFDVTEPPSEPPSAPGGEGA